MSRNVANSIILCIVLACIACVIARADIWTQGAAFPTNITFLKTTYRSGDVILAVDANKQNAEINAISRWLIAGGGGGMTSNQYITLMTLSNNLAVLTTYVQTAWQCGTNIISDYTNTVTFSPAFSKIPVVALTIDGGSMETLRAPVLLSVTNTGFRYKVIGSGGLVNDPMSINWIAIIK